MIEIRHIRGLCRGVDTDTTIDGIYLVDALHPKGARIGIVGRERGAPAQLLEPVSQSVMKEIGEALDARDFDELTEEQQAMAKGRRTIEPPPPEPEEDEEIDDDESEGPTR